MSRVEPRDVGQRLSLLVLKTEFGRESFLFRSRFKVSEGPRGPQRVWSSRPLLDGELETGRRSKICPRPKQATHVSFGRAVDADVLHRIL